VSAAAAAAGRSDWPAIEDATEQEQASPEIDAH